MSDPIVTSDLFLNLSNKEQELLTGGANFSLNGSNFANQGAVLMGSSTSGPLGSTANSGGNSNITITAAQDFLGLGGGLPLNITALGPATLPDGVAQPGSQPGSQPSPQPSQQAGPQPGPQ